MAENVRLLTWDIAQASALGLPFTEEGLRAYIAQQEQEGWVLQSQEETPFLVGPQAALLLRFIPKHPKP